MKSRQRALITCAALLSIGISSPSWAQQGKGFVSVNAGGQFGAQNFTQEVNLPQLGSVGAVYKAQDAPVFDFGGGYLVTPNFGFGATVSLSPHNSVAGLFAYIPLPSDPANPILLDGVVDADRFETGVHIQLIGSLPISDQLSITFYGGPSWIRVSQDLVDAVEFAEGAPNLGAALIRTVDSSAWGFNVGADISYFFTDIFGIGGGVRYTRATVEFPNLAAEGVPGIENPGTTESRAGGTQVIGGIRLRF